MNYCTSPANNRSRYAVWDALLVVRLRKRVQIFGVQSFTSCSTMNCFHYTQGYMVTCIITSSTYANKLARSWLCSSQGWMSKSIIGGIKREICPSTQENICRVYLLRPFPRHEIVTKNVVLLIVPIEEGVTIVTLRMCRDFRFHQFL